MALLVFVLALVLVGSLGAWLGTDSRPGPHDPPQQQWPFHPHPRTDRRSGPTSR